METKDQGQHARAYGVPPGPGSRQDRDVTALIRVSMLIGFLVGVLVASGVCWVLWGPRSH